MRRLALSLLLSLVSISVFGAFSGTDVFVGAVGRGPGAAGSDWYTSVWIHNPGATPATVTAYLLLRNQTNPSPATQTIIVQPGETRRIDNVVETLFGVNAFGAMRFTSAGKILVNARIYSKLLGAADSDSSGQSFDGVPASFAIGAGQSAAVLGVHQTSPFDASLFRYNFGWVETAGGSGTLRATALDGTGATLGTKDYAIGPYEARQLGAADVAPGLNSTNVRLTISIVDGTAKVIAFGSGIANRSNDPTTFDMSFRDELLAGPAAPASVSHDSTLTGDGTAAAPLAVASSVVFENALPFRTNFVPSTPRAIIDVANFGTTDGNYGLVGTGGAVGVGGYASAGTGILGVATDGGLGVVGKSTAPASTSVGVNGVATTGVGVLAQASSGIGLYAQSVSGVGLRAESQTPGGAQGIVATSFAKEGIKATSQQYHGVWGEAQSNDGYGVVATNTVGNHPALLGTLNWAGDFIGNVRVKGFLSTTTGTYSIDHPLSPESKTLSHSAVQSSDMKNIYDGVVITDSEGFAVVDLPEWFEALNGDFRYQLTCIGRFAQAIVDTEIAHNRFTIRTDKPNTKVSWQVTGIRRDPWSNAHRLVVEEEKPRAEQGYYLAPEVYGQPMSKDVFWAKHPELNRK